MRVALNNEKLKFYIGDVRDYDSIHQALKGVHLVFHAAALKQVPSCEFYPIEAVRTNFFGAENGMVARARLQNESETVLCATRYGNVMASRGSVIPHFIDQLKRGVPLTVTDPNMTRFLMSLDDSVDLVLHAYEHGKQGDIFVQK